MLEREKVKKKKHLNIAVHYKTKEDNKKHATHLRCIVYKEKNKSEFIKQKWCRSGRAQGYSAGHNQLKAIKAPRVHGRQYVLRTKRSQLCIKIVATRLNHIYIFCPRSLHTCYYYSAKTPFQLRHFICLELLAGRRPSKDIKPYNLKPQSVLFFFTIPYILSQRQRHACSLPDGFQTEYEKKNGEQNFNKIQRKRFCQKSSSSSTCLNHTHTYKKFVQYPLFGLDGIQRDKIIGGPFLANVPFAFPL